MANRNVFIVHGHDTRDLHQLKAIVVKLGLTPVILKEQPDLGLTMVEKFERYARDCVFAFILLTPDDRQASFYSSRAKKTDIFRARQNVIFEMGWFFCFLRRARTRLLHKGPVELPSDITGVVYLKYRSSVDELERRIVSELLDAGVLTTRPATKSAIPASKKKLAAPRG